MIGEWQPFLDNRSGIGSKPRFHALIVGVSDYVHLPPAGEDVGNSKNTLGLKRLSGPGLAAAKIYKWLRHPGTILPSPLASCNLLISPAASERHQIETELGRLPARACLENFRHAVNWWRDAASKDPSDTTFFYFAGHGIQRTANDSVLLLDEFGDPHAGLLFHAVSSQHIRGAMAPAGEFKNIAKHQLYFIDACRDRPGGLAKLDRPPDPTEVLSSEICGIDRRSAPVFHAAAPGGRAYALPGRGTDFSHVLLRCFEELAATIVEHHPYRGPQWGITVQSLNNALSRAYAELRKCEDSDIGYDCSHLHDAGALICLLPSPPKVPVSLSIDPLSALPHARVEVRNEEDEPIWQFETPLTPHPYKDRLPAGSYRVYATAETPEFGYTKYSRNLFAEPPRHDCKIVLTSKTDA